MFASRQLGVACLPCAGSQPLGQSHFCVTSPVLIDPEMGKIVKGLVANSYAEFRVRLLTDREEVFLYTLVLELETVRKTTEPN